MKTGEARYAELYSRIRSAIETTPAARMRTPVRTKIALAIIFVLSATILLLVSEFVYDKQAVGLRVDVVSPSRLVWATCLLLALTIASTTVALWRGRSGLGASAAFLAGAATFVAPLYAALVLASPIHFRNGGVPLVEISPWGVRCAAIAAVIGATALVGFASALRRAAPVASSLRGATLGAAAGAWAGLAVFIFCPSGDPLHLLLGHALPVAGFTLLGALALARALRP
jgi:hypothetical protein